MEQYKIKPNGFREIRKQLLLRTLPISILAIAVGLGVAFSNPTMQDSPVNIWPLLIPFILFTTGFGTWRAINRQKQLFESYCLTISDTGISREQKNTPSISIVF